MFMLTILLVSPFLPTVPATVDITLPQFQYLANHLTYDECVYLIQELFKIDSDIPEDLACLELLLFWNSSPGEGLGETHQLVCKCLDQIERNDLSVWLSKSVFEQLKVSHEKSIGKNENANKTDQGDMTDEEAVEEDADVSTSEWSVFDVAGFVVILVCLIVGVTLCASAFMPTNNTRRKTLDIKLLTQNKKYSYKYVTDNGKPTAKV